MTDSPYYIPGPPEGPAYSPEPRVVPSLAPHTRLVCNFAPIMDKRGLLRVISSIYNALPQGSAWTWTHEPNVFGDQPCPST